MMFGTTALNRLIAAPRSLTRPVAVFPGAIAGDMNLAVAANRLQTALAAGLDSVSLSMTVTDPSQIVAGTLLSIDNEIVQATALPTGSVVPISRAFDGTTAAIHLPGAVVSGLVDAWHHNALSAEVQAIEQALGPNLSQIQSSFQVVSTNYLFGPIVSGSGVSVTGGNLVVGSNVLTFAVVPHGVNGTDVDHYLWVSGGTGTAEAVKITGGSGTDGQSNGQIIVTCAYAHSGLWSIQNASNGIAEACVIVKGKGGGTVLVPGGTHPMRAPVRIFGYTTIQGVGQYNTLLQRTLNYGNTFVIGYTTGGDNNIQLQDLWIYQNLGYVAASPPTVANPVTGGSSHVLVQGGNTITFKRCRIENLNYGINIVGGAEIMIDDCTFGGLWSPPYSVGQITLADIRVANDSVLGIATYIKIRGAALTGGYRGPNNEVWCSNYRVVVYGVEDLEILGGAVAGAATNNIQLLPRSGSGGGILSNVRITAGVRFDGCGGNEINITGDGTGSAADVLISGCVFNGERLGLTFPYSLNAVCVAYAGSAGGLRSAVGLTIADNIIMNYEKSAIYLQDGIQFAVVSNMVYLYNLGQNTDSPNSSGIFAGTYANNGLIQDNMVGGDNTGTSAYGAGNNHCLYGITVYDPAVAQAQVTLVDNYPPFPGAIGTATDQIFNTRLNQVFFIPNETGANNAIAGSLPNVPLLRGLRVALVIAHSLQAGPNTFNLNGLGAIPIRSIRNPGLNISTPYVANGAISMLYDGAEWLDLSQ